MSPSSTRPFLNEGITPVIPSRGSIGDADITLASHVGATMMYEWKVTVNSKVMPAAEALKTKNIKPLVPQGKEGMNGNVAPFLAQTMNSHPLLGLQEAAAEFRSTLKGSYLW